MSKQYLIKTPLEHDQCIYEIGRVVDHEVFGDEIAKYLISTGTLQPLQAMTQMPPGAVPMTDVFDPDEVLEPARLNVNQADRNALEALAHVGARTADKIIAARPFQTLTQAHLASGLSSAKWADILPQLSL